MDVTEQVQQIHLTYGGSDSTNPNALSATRKLNYATGSSITSPEITNISVIPFTLNFNDSVGLYGSENHFIKVNIDVDYRLSNADKGVSEGDYFPAVLNEINEGTTNDFTQAERDNSQDITPLNTFDPALFIFGISPLVDGFMSIEIDNKGTNNKYVDSYLDVTLYSREREEHPYDTMYIRTTDFFYIGFHARKSTRLPYNVTCTIGNNLLDRREIEQRFIAKASRVLQNPAPSSVLI